MLRRIAILGAHPLSLSAFFALSEAQRSKWEIWALSSRIPTRLTHIDRLFEMHKRSMWGNYAPGGLDAYVDTLRRAKCPIYMREVQDDIPTSVRYPFERVERNVTSSFASSIAYMLALAISEGVDVVGLWGVELDHDSEYASQKPNLNYIAGIADGRGIEVVTPGISNLIDRNLKYGG